MSANLVVDLRNTTSYWASIAQRTIAASGVGTGVVVGKIVDLLHANTFTQVYAAGNDFSSGEVRILLQTSDATTSGSFTDPTSGLPAGAFPPGIHSGGVFLLNSGLWQSGGQLGASVSGVSRFASGGLEFGAFLRPHRYARLVLLSGTGNGIAFQSGATLTAGFVANLKTTGSGAGFTQSPASGVSGGAAVFV